MWMPGVTADELITRGGTITAVDLNVQRGSTGSIIHASFTTENVGTLHAQAHTSRDGRQRSIDINLQANNIAAAVFEKDLDAKASGQFRLQAQGGSLAELIGQVNTRLIGKLVFNQTDGEISLGGNPELRMDGNRLVGLNFENIRLNITNEELISGRLVYDVREPAIRGEVRSEGFDLDALLEVIPSSEATRAPEFGSVLSVLPYLDLQLEAKSLAGFGFELQEFSVRFENEPNKVMLHDLSFHSRFGKLNASARLVDWSETAQFELSGTLGDLVMSSVTNQQSMQQISDPMSGTIELSTTGEDWQALAGNLRGHLRLNTGPDTAPKNRVEVDLEVAQQGQGVSANLKQLSYGSSHLVGRATFTPGDPALLTVEASSEDLDLIALDALFAESEGETDSEIDADSLAAQADDVFRTIRSILGSPFQFFTGGADEESERFFSDVPVDLSLVQALESDIQFAFKDIVSSEAVFDQLTFTGRTRNGLLDTQLSASQDLGGTLMTTLTVDTNVQPYFVKGTTDIRNFRPGGQEKLAPTSMFADITSAGNTQAQLAATANGEIYVETGKGEADFANFALGFFTEDLIGRVGSVLLPDDDDEIPNLNCSVAYGRVTDGVLTTPKAMVIQSRTANVLIRAEVDMKEERLAAQFDSRSRTGAGISVGNVFSNTVRIRGSLKDPSLVPNPTGIIWRSWAALATGGFVTARRELCETRPIIRQSLCARARRSSGIAV